MMADTQHFCLRWNNYQSSITSAFENLRDDEDFVDVTLACDGKSLKAHRVVLSACSPYFRELLKSTPCKHPVIVLQDVAFADLHALVEFIYHGEVNVHQRNLSSFLKTAEVLRVSGLTQQADDRDELPGHSMLRGNMQHGFSDKMVEDALFTSPPSPPPPVSSGGGATVNQLLRRAAAAALASSNRRERHNSAEPQSDSSEQSQPPASTPSKRARTSAGHDASNSHHNNGESAGTTSVNQSIPTDFSTTFSSGKGGSRKTEPSEGNNADRDRDSSPSPTGGLLDGVKTEPVDMICNADVDNSNDSVEATADLGIGSHQQSSLSAGDQDDHDSIQGHPGSGFLSSTPESKLFGSVTSGGSFNFSMAALSADHSGLSGIANQSLQGNADGTAGTSSQELLGRGWAGVGPPYCPLCRKSFTRAWSLQRHMADTHFYVPQSFECDVCGRTYRSRNSLVSHKSQYHGGAAGTRAALKEAAQQPVAISTAGDSDIAVKESE